MAQFVARLASDNGSSEIAHWNTCLSLLLVPHLGDSCNIPMIKIHPKNVYKEALSLITARFSIISVQFNFRLKKKATSLVSMPLKLIYHYFRCDILYLQIYILFTFLVLLTMRYSWVNFHL